MLVTSTALSGLRASVMRLNASASNVANVDSTGPVPSVAPTSPGPPPQSGGASVYQPVRVQQSAVPSGGTIATYTPVSPGYVARFDSTSPHANADGMVAAPNVDFVSELAEQLGAALAYKANLKVVEAMNQLSQSSVERWA